MSELAKRFPELYAKLHPEGRFQAYFKAAKEFWSVAAQLPPQERWQRLTALSESKEAKHSPTLFRQDAEEVRRLVKKEYPSVPVALEIR